MTFQRDLQDTRSFHATSIRRFVAEGINRESPWLELKNQIYLGDDDFVDKMQRQIAPGTRLDEVPAGQKARPVKPLDWFTDNSNSRNEAIVQAYRGGGYSMAAITCYFGLHYSSVSKIIKRAENS